MKNLLIIVFGVCLGPACLSQVDSGLGLDSTFGVNGVRLVDLKAYDYTSEHVCDSGGHTFIFGTSGEYTSGVYDFDAVVIKLTPNGDLDNTFGQGGVVTFDFPNRSSSNISHGLIHEGSVFFIGAGYDYGVVNSQTVFIGKLDSAGNFETTFGQAGFLNYMAFGDYNIPGEIILDQNEKLVYSLTSLDTNYAHMEIPVMGRLSLNGIPDNSFGQNGQIFWHPLSGLSNIGHATNRHQDGAYLDNILELDSGYLFSGYYYVGEAYAAFSLMTDDTGAAVNSFGQNGQWLLNFNPGMNNRIDKAIEVDGNIWMLTDIEKHDDNKDLDIKVVNKNGVIQTHLSQDLLGNIDHVRNVMIDSNGRIFTLGTSIQMTNNIGGYRGDLGVIHSWLPSYLDNSDFAKQGTGTFNPDTMNQIDPQSISGHLFDDEFIVSSDKVYNGQSNYSDFQVLKLLNQSFNNQNALFDSKKTYQIYPNPSNGTIFIEGNEIKTITIHTLEGQLVRKMENSPRYITLDGFSSGVYIVKLKFKNGSISHERLVVN